MNREMQKEVETSLFQIQNITQIVGKKVFHCLAFNPVSKYMSF